MSDRQPFGVFYIVDKNPHYTHMLNLSIESLRRFHPDWPIAVYQHDSVPISPLRKAYRAVTFWKRKLRHNRLGQDARFFYIKMQAWQSTPFETTLFLDVDTIIRKPLDDLRRQAEAADLLITPIPWKQYHGVKPWMPDSFQYLNVGVVFYNQHFQQLMNAYADRLDDVLPTHPMADQYLVSLIQVLEPERIRSVLVPELQVDVINMQQAFGQVTMPMIGECLDLRSELLAPFHIFHYNEYKPQYIAQIADAWKITGDCDYRAYLV